MKQLQEIDIIKAVEQACSEETFGFTSFIFDIKDDAGAVVWGGGLTPRIAYILGRPVDSVRRRLVKLHKEGKMLRHGRRTSTYRWWPVGLLERVNGQA